MNPGEALEVAVERWLQRRFGAKTERRTRQRGAVAERCWEVDVHAVIPRAWKPAAMASLLSVVMGSMLAAGDMTSLALLFVFIGSTTGLLALILAAGPRHVWVEAKDRASSVKRVDMIKLVEASRDVQLFGEARWYPQEVWMVSSSDFDRDALNFARARGVRCFLARRGGNFVELR